MFIIIILIIVLIVVFYIMKRTNSTHNTVITRHLSKEVRINEIYLSSTIQKKFYNLDKERLTKEDFKYIIDLQTDEQTKMFLNYIYDYYYGCDTMDMVCIPFSTLIEEASHFSGYRI